MQSEYTGKERLTIPGGLPPELVETLGMLEDAPPGVAEATIALLPYGSRSNLAAHDIIGRIPARKDAAAEIRITDYGKHVITACARRFDDCGDTDEHPAVSNVAAREGQLLDAWRPRAEAVDRELTRVKHRVRERFEDMRSDHRTAH
jgi:hypothetical protein